MILQHAEILREGLFMPPSASELSPGSLIEGQEIFFLIYLFIYLNTILFIYAYVGSSFLCEGFL